MRTEERGIIDMVTKSTATLVQTPISMGSFLTPSESRASQWGFNGPFTHGGSQQERLQVLR